MKARDVALTVHVLRHYDDTGDLKKRKLSKTEAGSVRYNRKQVKHLINI